MGDVIKVLIVDHNVTVRQGLKALIATAADMRIVGEAGDGSRAVNLAAALRPDVITMDLVLPRMDGIEATKAIRLGAPHASVLILSHTGDPEQVTAAVRAGARGYLLKDAVLTNVIEAIRELHQGQMRFHPAVESDALAVVRELPAASIQTPPTPSSGSPNLY